MSETKSGIPDVKHPPEIQPWKLLLVDDEEAVHALSRMVFRDFVFKGRPVSLLSAYSSEEACALVKNNPDAAVLLLDMIMEQDDSGLGVVKYIRETLHNKHLRIILRTGCGELNHSQVLKEFDINDLKKKESLTADELLNSVTLGLRSFHDILHEKLKAMKELNAHDRMRELLKENKSLHKHIVSRIRTEQELRESKDDLQSIINNSHAIITLKDMRGRYILANKQFERMVGLNEYVGRTDFELFPKKVALRIQENDQKVAEARGAIQFEEHLSKETFLSVKFPILDENGEPTRICAISTDISDRAAEQKKLYHLAYHDPLTSLPNRELLKDRLEQSIARAKWRGRHLAVLFLDLDRFKFINDSMGHQAGDDLLCELARRLSLCVRDGDTVARLGGDEFAVVLNDLAEAEDALPIAEKILHEVEKPFQIIGRELFTSTSIGISVYPNDANDPYQLLKKADIAMYRAKSEGKNTFRFYNRIDESKAMHRQSLEFSLKRAMENNEFLLYYQPQIDIQKGHVTGVEALLRWRHPRFKVVSPKHFINLLEETGMIIKLGDWVLRTAFAQFALWRRSGLDLPRISINVSRIQFRDPCFPGRVAKLLAEYDIDPAAIELEIKENILAQDINETRKILEKLWTIGVQVGIDNFGTGFSSIAELQQLNFHSLKIDRSFMEVHDETAGKKQSLMTGLISLAEHLGQRVIAEGVETQEQFTYLRGTSCTEVQGYLFSAPIPANHLKVFLSNNEAKSLSQRYMMKELIDS